MNAELSEVRFVALWRALDAAGGSDESRARAAFARLGAAYDEPHRAYHGARHIAACLRLFDEPEVRALAVHPAEVEAALWFHDAVYDTRASDNEERSARLVEEILEPTGIAPEVVRRIAAHVLATKTHEARDPDGALVVDIDISILGEAPETYARFEAEIREEYAWVPPEAYAAGREAVLRRFVDRPFIYATPVLRARFEPRARENIAGVLSSIRRGGAGSAS